MRHLRGNIFHITVLEKDMTQFINVSRLTLHYRIWFQQPKRIYFLDLVFYSLVLCYGKAIFHIIFQCLDGDIMRYTFTDSGI